MESSNAHLKLEKSVKEGIRRNKEQMQQLSMVDINSVVSVITLRVYTHQFERQFVRVN